MICPECESQCIVEDTGFSAVCMECGLVVEEHPPFSDTIYENRYFPVSYAMRKETPIPFNKGTRLHLAQNRSKFYIKTDWSTAYIIENIYYFLNKYEIDHSHFPTLYKMCCKINDRVKKLQGFNHYINRIRLALLIYSRNMNLFIRFDREDLKALSNSRKYLRKQGNPVTVPPMNVQRFKKQLVFLAMRKLKIMNTNIDSYKTPFNNLSPKTEACYLTIKHIIKYRLPITLVEIAKAVGVSEPTARTVLYNYDLEVDYFAKRKYLVKEKTQFNSNINMGTEENLLSR